MKLRRLAPPSELGNMFGTGLSKQDARDGTCNYSHQIYVITTWKQLKSTEIFIFRSVLFRDKILHVGKEITSDQQQYDFSLTKMD